MGLLSIFFQGGEQGRMRCIEVRWGLYGIGLVLIGPFI